MTFDPTTDVVSTLLNLNLAPGQVFGLTTGQPVEYKTSGNAISGLTNNTTYYAIVVSDDQIELADNYADAVAGTALALKAVNGNPTQTLIPVTLADQCRRPDRGRQHRRRLRGAITTGSSNTGVAGSFSTDDVIATTKAYITTHPPRPSEHHDHAARRDGGPRRLHRLAHRRRRRRQRRQGHRRRRFGLARPGASRHGGLRFGATVTLAGDSTVSASNGAVIVAVAGSAALGGKGGYGVALAINLIGFSNQTPITPNEPAATLAYIVNSTITDVGGTLSVLATSANAGGQPSIIAIVSAWASARRLTAPASPACFP